jgi:hypothetical protein
MKTLVICGEEVQYSLYTEPISKMFPDIQNTSIRNVAILDAVFYPTDKHESYGWISRPIQIETNRYFIQKNADMILSIRFLNNESTIFVNVYIDGIKQELGIAHNEEKLYLGDNGFILIDKPNVPIFMEFISCNKNKFDFELEYVALNIYIKKKILQNTEKIVPQKSCCLIS